MSPQEDMRLSSQKRAVSVLFNEEEYSGFVRRAAEMTLEEGRRVSVAELVRRLTLSGFDHNPRSTEPKVQSTTSD